MDDPEFGGERIVARQRLAEQREIDAVGHHPDLARRNSASDQVVAQPLADREDRVRAFHHLRFEAAGEAVFGRAFGAGAVAHRGIFPEGADFIDQRNAERLCGAIGSAAAQRRRMGVDDVGTPVLRELLDRRRKGCHLAHVAHHHRHVRDACGAVEGEPIDLFHGIFGGRFELVALRSDPAHVQSRLLLRFQDRARAEGIAAVQRQRMVENVKDASHALPLP